MPKHCSNIRVMLLLAVVAVLAACGPEIPSCPEGSGLVGTGRFDGQRYERYECGPIPTATPSATPVPSRTPYPPGYDIFSAAINTLSAPMIETFESWQATVFAFAIGQETTPNATDIAESENAAVWATVAADVCRRPEYYGFKSWEYEPLCRGR